MRQKFATVALGLAVVLAGCAGGIAPGSGGGGDADGSGTVQFYVSDERNAIDQFEHLNVTISEVGFQTAEGAENATNGTTVDANATNGTTVDANATNGSDVDAEDGSWITHDANDTTVDLTELQGANATLIDGYDVPAGNYSTVFAHVSEVNGTLTTGEQVNVKLPSEKLQLHTPFTVGQNESVDFVFDITVFEAGQSGKYILKPVVSESGTDMEIEERGDERDDADERDEDDERSGLNATVDGAITTGENVTVTVTDGDGPVANATVEVNGETVGETDADGAITVTVPDEEEFELTATSGDREGELERPVGTATENGTTTAA